MSISIVIPIYNEESVIEHLYNRLNNVLQPFDYEVIFVDDSSKDLTLSKLKEINKKDNRYKIISLSRNFGHQIAISAGLKFCKGDAIIIMDGDLQDPPEIIHKFIEKWKKGYIIVYATRIKRKEILFLRILYKLFYKILKSVSKIDIPLDAGDFCLLDKKIVTLMNNMPEKNRFLRGLRSWIGFKQIGIEYEREKRFTGKTKYTLKKLLKLALDGIFSFSEIPLKITTIMGFMVSIGSIFYAVYIIFHKIFYTDIQISGWSSLIVSITFLSGIQLIVMGILGEYISRIFDEVKRRPLFIIDELVGF